MFWRYCNVKDNSFSTSTVDHQKRPILRVDFAVAMTNEALPARARDYDDNICHCLRNIVKSVITRICSTGHRRHLTETLRTRRVESFRNVGGASRRVGTDQYETTRNM